MLIPPAEWLTALTLDQAFGPTLPRAMPIAATENKGRRQEMSGLQCADPKAKKAGRGQNRASV